MRLAINLIQYQNSLNSQYPVLFVNFASFLFDVLGLDAVVNVPLYHGFFALFCRIIVSGIFVLVRQFH